MLFLLFPFPATCPASSSSFTWPASNCTIRTQFRIYTPKRKVEILTTRRHIQYSTVQYNTVQYNTVQYSTVQYSTVQYSTVQYSTVQYSKIQYNAIHYYWALHTFMLFFCSCLSLWTLSRTSPKYLVGLPILYSVGSSSLQSTSRMFLLREEEEKQFPTRNTAKDVWVWSCLCA